MRGIAMSHHQQSGHWPGSVHAITVLRRLAGGRSGSEVLEILVEHGQGRSRQVVKVSTGDAAAREWQAFTNVVQSQRQVMYVPIVAVSRAVLDPTRAATGERQAVVYQHASDRVGDDTGSVRTLEELFDRALSGTEEDVSSALQAVGSLMRRLRNSLYGGAAASSNQLSLREFNESLGPDLELEVDTVKRTADASIRLHAGSPSQRELESRRVHGGEVLRTSTAPVGSADSASLSVGSSTSLTLRQLRMDGAKITGRVDATTVTVHTVGEASEQPLPPELHTLEALDVYGRVVAVRSRRWSELMARVLSRSGDFSEDPVALTRNGCSVAHPLRSLHDVLDVPGEGRVRSDVHGDLNPRNVLVIGGLIFLIDYAAAERNGYLLADPAWLEICLLREVVAQKIGWTDMCRLQRYLALASVLASHWGGENAVDRVATQLARSLDETSPALGVAFQLLWAVRRGAWQATPRAAQGRWAEHYLQHLTLAACRTFKWADADQSEVKVSASAIAAGVAAEFMDDCRHQLFKWWPAADLVTACTALLADFAPPCPRSAALLAEAIAESDRRQADPQPSGVRFQQRLPAVINALGATAIEGCRAECRNGERGYIPLEARELSPKEPISKGEGALAISPKHCLELLMRHPAVVLIGDSGSGKTTVIHELHRRMLDRLTAPIGGCGWEDDEPPPCLPLTVSALRLSEMVRGESGENAAQLLYEACALRQYLTAECLRHLLSLGAVHVTIDHMHMVGAADRGGLTAWLRDFRQSFPRVHVVVCHRAWDYHPDLLGWPAVVLHKVTPQQARTYIADTLRTQHPGNWQRITGHLEARLFGDPDAVALRDLACTPRFLRILVDHYARTLQVPASPVTLLREYVVRLLAADDEMAADEPDGELPPEIRRKLSLLESLVRHMTDRGSVISYSDAVEIFAKFRQDNAEQELKDLLATDVLRSEGSWVAFSAPLVHAYCAASVLERNASDDLESVTERILHFDWREAARLLVAKPGVDPAVISAVLRSAMAASPAYAAWLLLVVESPASPFSRELLEQQQRTLCASSSGRAAWKEAAYALARYGNEQALKILQRITTHSGSAPQAAEAALDGLVMMHRWASGPRVPAATKALEETLRHLLDPAADRQPVPDSLVLRALRSAAVAGLTSLAGHIWSRVHLSEPWAVVEQAWRTLRQLAILPDRRLRATYVEACGRRLADINQELRTTADTLTADSLNEQRMVLLGIMAFAGHLETLLDHRFRAGLAERPQWQAMLQTAADSRIRCSPLDVLASHLLTPPDPKACQEWLTLLTEENDHLAVIAAHRLLAEGYTVEASRLESIGSSASPARLAVVAGFVHCLSPRDLAVIERLVDLHSSRIAPDYIEPLSCLVSAAGTLDHELRPRLALTVQRALSEDQLENALYWPWSAAWRQAIPDRTEIAQFLALEDHQDDSAAALAFLSSVDVLLDAPPPTQSPPLTLADQERLHSLQPRLPQGLPAHRFVMVAANAGLYESLRFALEVAQDPLNMTELTWHSHGQHGLVEVCLAAHATAAVGYLGRLAYFEGHTSYAEDAYHALLHMGPQAEGLHASLERARLIGLGFLGDWRDLLSGITPDDPVLASAAHNIIEHWLPGPFTLQGETCLPHVASWISGRLKMDSLPATTRAVLAGIRDNINSKLGRYVH
ncbi:hypothetical protein GCM10009753_45310 [Streptantibioticus ferralitis]